MNAPALASMLTATADDIAQDNAIAERERVKRMIDVMHQFCDEFGLCNAVGMLADYAEKQAERLADYTDGLSDDYELARQILDGAAAGVDLPYKTGIRRKESRAQAIERVQEMARELV